MNINRQNINNQNIKIEDDYNECLKIIFSMCCLLIFIFLIALIVTLIIVYGRLPFCAFLRHYEYMEDANGQYAKRI